MHPDIRVQQSKQLLYGRYPYRLVIRCHGSHMLRYPEPFEDQLQWSSQWRNINYGGSWRYRQHQKPNADELKLLTNLKLYREESALLESEEIKMRIENPLIQIYAKDIKQLEEFVTDVFANFKHSDFLESITLPKNSKDLDLLTQGYVLRSHTDYAFKVNLRDGKYNHVTRSNLLKYLDQLGPDVSVPKSTRLALEKNKGDFIWSAYFYCMDENITLMISMMDPRLIRSIDRYHSTAK